MAMTNNLRLVLHLILLKIHPTLLTRLTTKKLLGEKFSITAYGSLFHKLVIAENLEIKDTNIKFFLEYSVLLMGRIAF